MKIPIGNTGKFLHFLPTGPTCFLVTIEEEFDVAFLALALYKIKQGFTVTQEGYIVGKDFIDQLESNEIPYTLIREW